MNVHLETWNFQLDMTLQGSKIMIWKNPVPNQSNAPFHVPVEMGWVPKSWQNYPTTNPSFEEKKPLAERQHKWHNA